MTHPAKSGLPVEHHRLRPLLLPGAALLALCAAFYWGDPATSRLFWPCPFHWLTGLHCPGCGAQRALHALLHGRVVEALSANAFAVLVVFPLACVWFGDHVLKTMGWRHDTPMRLDLKWVIYLAAVAAVFGILRNLPLFPFNWLAP